MIVAHCLSIIVVQGKLDFWCTPCTETCSIHLRRSGRSSFDNGSLEANIPTHPERSQDIDGKDSKKMHRITNLSLGHIASGG